MRIARYLLAPVMGSVMLIAAIGCGDSHPVFSPTAPAVVSPSPGPPSTTGATIHGIVNGGSGFPTALSATTGGKTVTLAGMSVTVVGTTISASVDSAGRFILTGIPAGSIQLQFTGPGVNTPLVISGINEQEEIRIAVTVTDNSVTLETLQRVASDNRVEVEGNITAIDLAARTVRVAGSTVSVPVETTIRHGSRQLQLSDLTGGDRIHVKGVLQGGVVQAREIAVQNQNHEAVVEVEGLITSLGGDCPNLTFTVAGTAVTTNGSTHFKGAACRTLKNGSKVEVKGRRQATGSLSLLALEVEIDDEDKVELRGLVLGLSGSCPSHNLTFLVNGTTVVTDSSTKFEGGCGAVQNGKKVEVEGYRQSNGSVLAKKVEIEEQEVEVKGLVSGLSGSCPSHNLTFLVNGTTVVTDSSTKFEGGCGAVQNGKKVEVEGYRQSNGSVLAKVVEIDGPALNIFTDHGNRDSGRFGERDTEVGGGWSE